MTKKHFIALADAMRYAMPTFDQPTMKAQWTRDLCAIAGVCKSANPRFNEARWLGYINGTCGPNGGSIKASK